MTEPQKKYLHMARAALLNAIIITPVTHPIYDELNDMTEWLEDILTDKEL